MVDSQFPRLRFGLLSRSLLVLAATAILAHAEEKPAASKYPTFGHIVRKDPRLDKILPRDAKLEKLAEGFDWSEGPVWIKKGGYLLFSDIPPNKIMKWKEGEGVSLFMHPSGYTGGGKYSPEPGSNGLLLDPQGRLILCQHGDRRLTRVEPDGKWTTLVDRYQGKRLNSPNDAVLHSSGAIYFTDPPYGLPKRFDSKERELDYCGVYRLSTDGKLTLLTKDVSRPNGIAFSPDENTLYVAVSDRAGAVWMAFDVKPDGTLGKSRVFYDANQWVNPRSGVPDGMTVDTRGNIFATGPLPDSPAGVLIFDPDGTLLGWIATGQRTANCAFGDDGHTLYVTADMFLGRIRVRSKGLGF